MKKTDCGSEFDILVEGKSKELMEMDEKQWSVSGVQAEFVYSTGFQNIVKDGRTLKGCVAVVFFEK